jgi:hypothetical protein
MSCSAHLGADIAEGALFTMYRSSCETDLPTHSLDSMIGRAKQNRHKAHFAASCPLLAVINLRGIFFNFMLKNGISFRQDR